MIFLYGLILGLILGFLISYITVKYNNRQEKKYIIEVIKTQHEITNYFPYIYKCITNVYLFKTLTKMLNEINICKYRINMENEYAQIILKTTNEKIKELINYINNNDNEFYTIKVKRK